MEYFNSKVLLHRSVEQSVTHVLNLLRVTERGRRDGWRSPEEEQETAAVTADTDSWKCQ